MKNYELIIENPINAFILDKEKNEVIALCNTKRPDLRFNKLKNLVEKANKNRNQLFQLGDIAYMLDEDYGFFESKVYRIELDNGKYYYTTNDCDFEEGDIGKWVFKSKTERELRDLEEKFREVGYFEEIIEEIKYMNGAVEIEEFINNLEEEQSNWVE